MKQSKYLLRDFTRESFIGGMVFHAGMHFFVAKVLALMDERLPDLVVGSVVQVLGSKGRFIDSLIAAISALNHMLLNELHSQPPTPAQSSPSCVWLVFARRDEHRNYI